MPCGRLPCFLLGTGGDFLMPNAPDQERARSSALKASHARVFGIWMLVCFWHTVPSTADYSDDVDR